ncbi:hypothetical protein KY284_007738 [Solanum tuberosum]|nr:hypothetical protein KY284_007738 [Solanum tuberosum]
MKRGDEIVKSKGVELVTLTEAFDFPLPGMSNINIEAKEHPVEILDNENERTKVSSRQLPKSLARIRSFPSTTVHLAAARVKQQGWCATIPNEGASY